MSTLIYEGNRKLDTRQNPGKQLATCCLSSTFHRRDRCGQRALPSPQHPDSPKAGSRTCSSPGHGGAPGRNSATPGQASGRRGARRRATGTRGGPGRGRGRGEGGVAASRPPLRRGLPARPLRLLDSAHAGAPRPPSRNPAGRAA